MSQVLNDVKVALGPASITSAAASRCPTPRWSPCRWRRSRTRMHITTNGSDRDTRCAGPPQAAITASGTSRRRSTATARPRQHGAASLRRASLGIGAVPSYPGRSGAAGSIRTAPMTPMCQCCACSRRTGAGAPRAGAGHARCGVPGGVAICHLIGVVSDWPAHACARCRGARCRRKFTTIHRTYLRGDGALKRRPAKV